MSKTNQILRMLKFIRDFGNINTTRLINQIESESDNNLVDACEATLQAAHTPLEAFDNLRSLCLGLLLDERPAMAEAQYQARTRLSPFAVSSDLVKELFTSPYFQYDFGRMSIVNRTHWFDLPAKSTVAFQPHSNEAWLITTLWAATTDPSLIKSKYQLSISNFSTAALEYYEPLAAPASNAVPLLLKLEPNSGFNVSIHNVDGLDSNTFGVLVALEGWRVPTTWRVPTF